MNKQRESAEFRVEALSLLQKLVSDPSCLSYGEEKGMMPIIDKQKLDYFVEEYKDVEPECAKALGFDYNIEVVQFSQKIKTYPGELLIEGECAPYNGLAFHPNDPDYLVVCDKDLSQEDVRESCCEGCEQDIPLPGYLGNCSYCCKDTCLPLEVYCRAYNCSQYMGSPEECESIDETTQKKICCVRQTCSEKHTKLVVCYNIDPEKDCKEVEVEKINGYCGNVGMKRKIKIGKTISVGIAAKSWNFSVGSGVSSFSPEAAVEDQVEFVLPVVIRYNSTYSANGEIHFKAVKGQLETFYSRLEDICEAAEKGKPKRIVERFTFRYPIVKRGNQICMLDRCKIFKCPFNLNMPSLGEGEYILKIYFNQTTGEIVVKK